MSPLSSEKAEYPCVVSGAILVERHQLREALDKGQIVGEVAERCEQILRIARYNIIWLNAGHSEAWFSMKEWSGLLDSLNIKY